MNIPVKTLNYFYGIGFAFLTVLLWASNSLVAAYFTGNIPTILVTFSRWTIAALILLPLTYRAFLHHRILIRHQMPVIMGAALCIFCDNFCFYRASVHANPVHIGLFASMPPLFLVIIELCCGKRLTWQQIIGVLLAFIGLLYAITKGNLALLLNLPFSRTDSLLLICAFAFALYTHILSYKKHTLPAVVFLGLFALCVSLFNLPFLLFSLWQNPQSFILNSKDILILCYIGVMISCVSYLCWGKAIEKIGPLKTGIFKYFEMPLTALWAFIVFQNSISFYQMISGLCIIFGAVLIEKRTRKRPELSRRHL